MKTADVAWNGGTTWRMQSGVFGQHERPRAWRLMPGRSTKTTVFDKDVSAIFYSKKENQNAGS